LIGTNTGPGVAGHRIRISGFEVWQIGADGLIASSQGHFGSSEYRRQFDSGVTERIDGTIPASTHSINYAFPC